MATILEGPSLEAYLAPFSSSNCGQNCSATNDRGQPPTRPRLLGQAPLSAVMFAVRTVI